MKRVLQALVLTMGSMLSIIGVISICAELIPYIGRGGAVLLSLSMVLFVTFLTFWEYE